MQRRPSASPRCMPAGRQLMPIPPRTHRHPKPSTLCTVDRCELGPGIPAAHDGLVLVWRGLGTWEQDALAAGIVVVGVVAGLFRGLETSGCGVFRGVGVPLWTLQRCRGVGGCLVARRRSAVGGRPRHADQPQRAGCVLVVVAVRPQPHHGGGNDVGAGTQRWRVACVCVWWGAGGVRAALHVLLCGGRVVWRGCRQLAGCLAWLLWGVSWCAAARGGAGQQGSVCVSVGAKLLFKGLMETCVTQNCL